MSNQPQAPVIEFQIIPKEIVLPDSEKLTLQEAFSPYFEQAEQMRVQCEGITEPDAARSARLQLKKLRNEAEKKRVALKANIVVMGRAIDGANNLLLGVITPIETKMDEIEKAELRRQEQAIADLHEERYLLIEPYRIESFLKVNFGIMPQEEFDRMLSDAKELHQSRADRERRETEERQRREADEAAEKERLRLENERLQEQARIAAEAARVERERLEKENAALEAKAAQERKEREELERQQELENQRRLNAERALADEERRKREAAEAQIEAERKRVADEEQRQKDLRDAAAKAPDKAKLKALAESLLNAEFPNMVTAKGRKELDEIKVRYGQLSAWISAKAANL